MVIPTRSQSSRVFGFSWLPRLWNSIYSGVTIKVQINYSSQGNGIMRLSSTNLNSRYISYNFCPGWSSMAGTSRLRNLIAIYRG
jgi:hypothetical protein